MSLADRIAPQLPYLRRYARALTGNQASGDAYVSATLETLIADPDSLAHESNPRVGLFRLFSKIWNSVDVNVDQQDEPMSQVDRRIEAITPLPRQSFLLTSVEGFTTEEAARILDTDLAEVEQLVLSAGREIAEQVATRVLIIEDEPIISMDLEALVGDLGHTVTGVAQTHDEAVQLAGDQRPGLVLADIKLADGSSGLEAVNEILQGFSVPVVFITAYPERLLTGTRPEPTFLITKPFDASAVRAIIGQALFFNQSAKAPV